MRVGIMHRYVAMEEAATGVAKNEIEMVFYAKVDFEWLLESAQGVEDQEQWEIKIPKTEGNQSAGRMRVRRTKVQGKDPEYVQTVKTRLPDIGEKEIPTLSSIDGFEQFKSMSDRGMVKRRYLIECEGRKSKWEVDVFFNEDGSPHEWAKVDFELQEGETEFPLPHEKFMDVKRADRYPKTPTGKQDVDDFIRNLYETVFLKCHQPAQPL